MLTISDDYYYGFVDGEGCFYVGIVPSKDLKLGWQVIPFFKVSQNPTGKVILDGLKKRLNAGYLKQNDKKGSSDISLALVVRNIDDLQTKVIPFFDSHLVIKRKALTTFKNIVERVQSKKHLDMQGLIEIIDLAYSMNTLKRKVSKEHIIAEIQKKSSQTTRQTPLIPLSE